MALITPLRDGMNLVAKEFVACQDDDDPGVLILSPFAGAGGIMQEALQVGESARPTDRRYIRIRVTKSFFSIRNHVRQSESRNHCRLTPTRPTTWPTCWTAPSRWASMKGG